MSTVESRTVELGFNNKQFESGVNQSLSTLDKLKKALNFNGTATGLQGLQKSANSFSMANVASNIQTVASRFSALGIVGDQVLRKLTDSAINMGKNILTAIPNQILSGGKSRAQNIEQAKFQLRGLLGEDEFNKQWELINKNINDAVSGTAYGYDAAAKVASQLRASNIEFGDDMAHALRAVSGVAAMTNSSYEDIGHIFTTIAGQGRMMADQLNQFANRGLNVASELAKHYKVSEAELRKMVSQGKVDFKTFAEAMNDAFGEHATKANETFSGALSNVKASLSRMGAQFATPAYDNLRLVLVALIDVFKDIEKVIAPVSERFKELAEAASSSAVAFLGGIHNVLQGHLALRDAKKETEEATKKTATGFAGISAILVSSEKANKKAVEDTTSAYKTLDEVAKEVIAGTYGYGEERRKKIEALGYSFEAVQNKVNELLGVSKRYDVNEKEITETTKDTTAVVNEQADAINKTSKEVTGFAGISKVLQDSQNKEKEAVEGTTKEYEELEQIAKDVIGGKYGSGEERKKKIEELGLSYSVVQNKVNELLGATKRYEVTAEDEAKTAAYFGQQVTKTTEEATTQIAGFNVNAEKLQNTFDGITSAIHIVTQAGSALYENIVKPFVSWGVSKLLDTILTMTGGLGVKLKELDSSLTTSDFFNVKFKAIADGFISAKNTVTDFIKAAKELEGVKAISTAFGRLKQVIDELWSGAITKLQERFGALGESIKLPKMDFFLNILNVVTQKIADFINALIDHRDAISGFFAPIQTVGTNVLDLFGKALSKVFEIISGTKLTPGVGGISDFLDLLGQIAGALGSGIVRGLVSLGEGLSKAFGGSGLEKIFSLFTSGALTTAALNLTVLSKGIGSLGNKLQSGGILGALTPIFTNLNLTLVKMQNSIRAKTLLQLAVAIAVLTGALLVLASLDPSKLSNALSAMAGLFAELVIAFGAIQAIINSNSIFGGLKYKALGSFFIMFAAAIGILTLSLYGLSKMDTEGIFKGLLTIGSLMAMLVIASRTMKSNLPGIIATGIGMILIASAIKKLTKAMKAMSTLTWEELIRGLVGVAGALGVMVIAMRFMPTAGMIGAGVAILIVAMAMNSVAKAMGKFGELEWESILKGLVAIGGAMVLIGGVLGLMPAKGMISAAVGILIISVALKSLAGILKDLESMSWEGVAKGLIAIAGVMITIAAASVLMSGTGIGAGIGLLLIAGAIRLLVPALESLGQLSLGSLMKGLLGLAAAFVIIAAGVLLLKPLTLTIIALSGAFVLFGIGALTVSAAIAILAGALIALAASGAAIGKGLVDLIGMFLQAIIDNFTAILYALIALGEAVITAVQELIPKLVFVAISALIAVLQAVRDNIYQITVLVGDIVVAFVDALTVLMPKLVDAGLRFIAAFINGIADGLKYQAPVLIDALGNLIEGLIVFAISALAELVRLIPGVGEKISGILKGLVSDATSTARSIEGVLNGLAIPEEKKITIKAIVTDLQDANGEEYSIKLDELETEIGDLHIPWSTRKKLLEDAFTEIDEDAEEKMLISFDKLNAEVNHLNLEEPEKKKLLGLIKALASGDTKEIILATLDPILGTINNLKEDDKERLLNYAQSVVDAEKSVDVTFTTLNATIGEFATLTEEQKTDLQTKINGLTSQGGINYSIALGNLKAWIGQLDLEPYSKSRLMTCVQDYLNAHREHNVLFSQLKVFAGEIGFTTEGLNDFLTKVRALGGDESTQYDVFFSTLTPSIGTIGKLNETDQHKLFGYVQQVVTDHGAEDVTFSNLNALIGNLNELTEDQKTELQTKLNDVVNSTGMQYTVSYGNLKAWIGQLDLEPYSKTRLTTYVQSYLNSAYDHKVSMGNLNAYVSSLGLSGEALKHFLEEVEKLGSDAIPENGEVPEVTIESLAAYIQKLDLTPAAQAKLLTLAQDYCNNHENAFRAKVKLLSVLIQNQELDSESEREDLLTKVRGLTGLHGTTLKVALQRLRVDIVNSSLTQEAKEGALTMIENFADMLGNAYTRRLQKVMEEQKTLPEYVVSGEKKVEIKAFSNVEKALEMNTDELDNVNLEGVYGMLADQLKYDNADNSIATEIVKSFLGDEFTQEEYNELLKGLFPKGLKGNNTVLDKEFFMNLLGGVEVVDNAEEYVEKTIEGLDLSDEQKSMVKKFKEIFDPYNMETDELFSLSLQEQFDRWELGIDITKSKDLFADVIDKMLEMDPEDLDAIFAVYPDLESYINNWVKTMTFDDPEHYKQQVSKGIEESTEEGIEEGVDAATGKFDLKSLINTALSSDDPEASKKAAEQITALYKSGAEGASKEDILAALKENVPLQEFIDEQAAEGVDTSNVYNAILSGLRMGSFSEDSSNIMDTLGYSIDNGLATGVIENAGDVVDAVTTMVEDAGDAAYTAAEVNSPSKLFMRLGYSMDEGLALGLTRRILVAKAATAKVIAGCLATINSKLINFINAGFASGTSYSTGVSNSETYATSSGRNLADAAENGIRERLDKVEKLGEYWGDGFIKGVRSKIEDAKKAGAALGKASEEGEREATGTDSPSKVATRLGGFFGQGYVNGINSFAKTAGKASADMANMAIQAVRTPMQIIQDILDSDMDYDPVITPVVDLSEIQNGARTINGLLPTGRRELGMISARMANRHEATNSDIVTAIAGLSGQMEGKGGDTFVVDGITYDDGSNITDAVRTLVRAARVERRR